MSSPAMVSALSGAPSTPRLGLSAKLFVLIFFLVPFNGFPGPSFLRELSVEAAIYPIIGFTILNIRGVVRAILSRYMYVFAIFVFFIVNMMFNQEAMITNIRGYISGVDKFISSSFVFFTYLLFSVSIYSSFKHMNISEISALVGKVVRPVTFFLIPFWLVEVFSWYSGDLRAIIEPIKRTISIGPYFQIGRLYGVSFEPSFNAIVMIGFLPFLIYRLTTSNGKLGQFTVALVVLLALCVFSVLSDSRTAYVAVALEICFAIFFMLATNSLRRLALTSLFPLFCIMMPTCMLFYVAWDLSAVNLSETSISNITRLTSINAALNIWWGHIWFGAGFGQYGFYYNSGISSVGIASWEVENFLYLNRWQSFAPSYSIFGRILAETGVFGFVFLFGMVTLVVARLKACLQYVAIDRRIVPLVALCLVGMSGAMMVGLSYDSYRQAFLWIFLGLSAAVPSICRNTALGSDREKVDF